MGRGLSDLQRWILWRAAEMPDGSERDIVHMLIGRVIAEYFAIKPDLGRNQWLADGTAQPGAYFGQNFRTHAEKAATARAAVCRAIVRLEKRELLERSIGVKLNPAGLEVAAGIEPSAEWKRRHWSQEELTR